MPDGVYKVEVMRSFIQLTRPVYILIACLLYLLGAGVSRYLSGQVEWMALFLGFGWMVLILIGFQYLNEYFYILDTKADYKWWKTPFSGSTGILGPGKLPRPVALWGGCTCLTVATYLTVLLNQNHWLDIQSGIILGVIFVGELVYVLPPFRLVLSGYGELIMVIIMAGFIPVQAFLLQGQEIHRLMVMVSLPLIFLLLGMLLAFEFPAYASDIKYERRPLLIRIGWQKGMLLHNFLVISSFLIFGLAFVFGFPLSFGWPVLLVLPVGFMQVWLMNRIAAGGKTELECVRPDCFINLLFNCISLDIFLLDLLTHA